MTQQKWFLVVPTPLSSTIQSLLDDMPGWGHGPGYGEDAQIIHVNRADLRDALIAAGATRIPNSASSSSAIPADILNSIGLKGTETIADVLTQLYGDESWAE